MRTVLHVLSSILVLDSGVPDLRAGAAEDERARSRLAFARAIAPAIGGNTPEPPLFHRIDCNRERLRDCVRFCVRQYGPHAASQRCVRACNQYCRSCTPERRPYCRVN